MDRLDRGLSKYFDGWHRYGVKEKDGTITTIYPDDMPIAWLSLDPEDEIYFGPAKDVRSYYQLHPDLKKRDLGKHQVDGKWRPGRLVVESNPDNYQVWVHYAGELGADQRPKGHKNWATVGNNRRIVHCDHKMDEKVPKAHKMSPIFQKLARYFGQYEFGVYKEAVGEKDGAVWAVEPKDARITYLKAMNAQGKHIFIRPTFENEAHFMMHDDVDRKGLAKHHQDDDGHWKPGRLVVESSPGNFQVWVKTDRSLSVEEKKHWLSMMHSDPGASPLHRWGRAPGFRNRKAKYRTEKGYPLARLGWIDWKNKANIPHVEIKQETRHTTYLPTAPQRIKRGGPLPNRNQYYKGVDEKGKVKESEQDFAYMLAMLSRGADDDVVKARVRSERTNWDNHQGPNRMEHYLEQSLKKAKAIVGANEYRIDIYRGKKNPTRLKSVSVTGIPNGHDHKRYLTRQAKDIVVTQGLEVDDISVDIRIRNRNENGKTKKLNRRENNHAQQRGLEIFRDNQISN